MKCRYCGSSEVHRSHRRDLKERFLLRMLLRAPYRCNNCTRRFAHWYLGPDIRAKDYLGLASTLRFWAGTIAMWLAIILLILIVFRRTAR